MVNERVTVTVNGQRTTFFLGLSVRHAIGQRAARAVQEGRAEARDGAGNAVGLDGALYDGEVLVVTRLAPASSRHPIGARAQEEHMDARTRWMQESLFGDERLRSELTDDEAQIVLDWGVAHLDRWVQASAAISDDEQAKDMIRPAMNRVRAIVRGMNHFIADKGGMDTDTAVAELSALFLPEGQEAARSPVPPDCVALAAEKDALSNVDLLRRMAALADDALPLPEAPAAPAAQDAEQPPAPEAAAAPAQAEAQPKQTVLDAIRGLFGWR